MVQLSSLPSKMRSPHVMPDVLFNDSSLSRILEHEVKRVKLGESRYRIQYDAKELHVCCGGRHTSAIVIQYDKRLQIYINGRKLQIQLPVAILYRDSLIFTHKQKTRSPNGTCFLHSSGSSMACYSLNMCSDYFMHFLHLYLGFQVSQCFFLCDRTPGYHGLLGLNTLLEHFQDCKDSIPFRVAAHKHYLVLLSVAWNRVSGLSDH